MSEDSFVNHLNNTMFHRREEIRQRNIVSYQPDGENGRGVDPDEGTLPSL
jgi:hypothetical protein